MLSCAEVSGENKEKGGMMLYLGSECDEDKEDVQVAGWSVIFSFALRLSRGA